MAVKLGEAFVEVYARLDKLEAGFAQAEHKAQNWTTRVGGFMTNALSFAAGSVITAGIGAITGAISGLASGMIQGNAEFEQYEQRFAVLLKDAGAAKQRLAELADFGAKTPFDLPEVVRADTILQGFGLHAEDTAKKFGFSGSEIRRIAGDVASGSGASFEQIAGYLGKFSAGATGEAIMRFQELGIVTREQLTKMGVEFDKSGALVSPLPAAMTALLRIMNEKYGGMMAVQSSTFSGMLSNMRDWMGQASRIMGEPIFAVIKQDMQGLLSVMGSASVKAAIAGIGQAIANVITLSNQLMQSLRSAFVDSGILGNVAELFRLLSGGQTAGLDFGAAIQWVFAQISSLIIELNWNVEVGIALLRAMAATARDTAAIISSIVSILAGSAQAAIAGVSYAAQALNQLRQGHVKEASEELKKAEAAMAAVGVAAGVLGTVGSAAFGQMAETAKALGVEIDAATRKASRLKAALGGGGLTGLTSADLRAELRDMRTLGDTGVAGANDTAAAWNNTTTGISGAMDDAAQSVKSFFDSALTGAQNALRGLLPEMFPSDAYAPGANGPFENIFRAADVAKQGDASPWAAKLGLTQEQAKKIVQDFASGFFTDDVRGLIDMQKLIDDAKLKQAAETMKTKFVSYLAGASGASKSVVESLLGTEGGVTAVQNQIADPLKAAFDQVTAAINRLIDALNRLPKNFPTGTNGTGGKNETGERAPVSITINAGPGGAMAVARATLTAVDILRARGAI